MFLTIYWSLKNKQGATTTVILRHAQHEFFFALASKLKYLCMYIYVNIPFSSKKKNFHLWITLWIQWDLSSCTSEEQVTLHIENYLGCPHYHKWKFKWKFFEVPRDFTCSLYSFFVWPVTLRWHFPSEITCENQHFSHEFSLIEFKIHKFLFTFTFILI